MPESPSSPRPASGRADGTREHPFSRIGDAIQAASPGQTILVAEETSYDEELVIDRPVHILASPPETAAEDASTMIRPAVGPGVIVSPGVIGVIVRGLVIERAKGAGVWIAAGASAKLDGVMIHAVELDGDGHHGYGILASDGASAEIVRAAVDALPPLASTSRGPPRRSIRSTSMESTATAPSGSRTRQPP